MSVPTLSDVRDQVKRVAELIRRLETAEDSDNVFTLSYSALGNSRRQCKDIIQRQCQIDRYELP
jgi:hypothetical protein